MRYKAKAKDFHLIVKAKASFGEEIDEKALDAFARVYLRGFLRPKTIKKNIAEYSGPIGISLYDRLKRPLTKRDFLFVLEQIVVAVQKIRSNNFVLNNIVLDIRNVYINDVTKEIQFLYVPYSKNTGNQGLIPFVESIVYSVIPAEEKDTECISRFIYFLKNQTDFIPEVIEKYIEREDRSVVNTIKKQNAGQSGFMTSDHKHYYEHYESKHEGDNDDPTGLLESYDEPTGLLSDDSEATEMLDGDDEATGYLGEDDDEATGLLGQDNEDGTALLDENQSVHYPTLFRVLTEETISIDKPVFRLGKERSYVDYFVTNNNAVSRSHADIITRGSRYFVIDLNSKNHTYINDQIVEIQFETELYDGDHLKLGNEEFIVNIGKVADRPLICPNCKAQNKTNSQFCAFCGTKL